MTRSARSRISPPGSSPSAGWRSRSSVCGSALCPACPSRSATPSCRACLPPPAYPSFAAVPASAVDASQEYFETVASKLLPSQILQSALTYDLHSKSSGGGHVPVGQRLPSTQTGGSSSAATNQRSRPRLRERQQDEADPSWVKWTGPDLEAEKSRCGGGALVMRVSDILLRLRFRRAKTSTFGLIMGPQRASNLGFDTTISSPTTS